MTEYKLPEWKEILHRLRNAPPLLRAHLGERLTNWGDADKRIALAFVAEFEAKSDAAKTAAEIAAFRIEQSGELADLNNPEAREALVATIAGAVAEVFGSLELAPERLATLEEDHAVVQRFLGLEKEWETLPAEVKALYPWPETPTQ